MKKHLQPNSARPPFLLRAVRRQPHLYSAICKARLLYSRRIAGANMRELFRRNETLLALNDFEREQVCCLRERGYALIPEFFFARDDGPDFPEGGRNVSQAGD